MRVRLLILAAVIAVPAFAQTIYSWEDSEGVHYTDDPSQIPKKAKVQKEAATTASTKKATVTAVAVAPTLTSTPASTEYEWRDLFIGAHRRIQTLRKSIAALEATLPPRTECVPQPVGVVLTNNNVNPNFNVNTVPGQQQVFCQVNPLHDQLRVQLGQEAVQLKNAELDLEQLERRASMVGVPREWRRGW